jgi:hypothetical protein
MISILKTTDVARLLDCTTETINGLAASGYLPAIKVGRSWIFMPEPLTASLSEKCVNESKGRQRTGNSLIHIDRNRRTPPRLPELDTGESYKNNRKMK